MTVPLVALLAAAIGWALWPVPAVAVVDETAGRTIAHLAVGGEAPLRLAYVHSIYRQPAVEEFVVRADGLTLVRLSSPSVAVLEYYARPEPILRPPPAAPAPPTAPVAEVYEIQTAPLHYARLDVRVGAVGQRTLTYAGREVPLYQLVADGDRVSLTVGRVPRLALGWPGAH